MIPFVILLRKFSNVIKKGIGIIASSISTILVILYGTFSEYYIESALPGSGIHSLFTSLWWTMQTLTTVGYGDVTIVGYLGKLNAMIIMIVGIGSLGFLLASVSANIVNSKISQKIGGVRVMMRNHVVLCNYDPAGREIVKEMNRIGMEVVIVSSKEIKEDSLDFEYIKGTCLEKRALELARIQRSEASIILAGKYADVEEATEIDARTILMGMTIKKMSPETRVVAEILEHDNEEHAINAGIDEAIVRGDLSSLLLSRSILSPGVTELLKDLIVGTGEFSIVEKSIKHFFGQKYSSVYDKFVGRDSFVLFFKKAGKVVKKVEPDEMVECDSVVLMTRKSAQEAKGK